MGRTHDTTTGSIKRRAAALAVAAVLGLTACGGSNDSATSEFASDDSGDAMEESEAEFDEAADGDDAIATNDAATSPVTGGAELGSQVDLSDREIITSVGLTMATSNVRETAADVRRLAEANGAAVFGSDVSIGDEEPDGSVPGGGQIVIRVVPAQLDGLVSALDGVGTVTRLSQDSQDVTDQLIDLDIRIRQTETSIERLEKLLDEAGALDDVFELERELTDRVIELEQFRASERNTENLVALATLTVQIEYRTPDVLDEIESGDDGIGDAFSDGWSAFVGFLFGIGYVLAVSAPFLFTLLGLGLLAWVVSRRLRRRSAEKSEQRRLDSDRAGSAVAVPSPAGTPPPPVASQRIGEANADTSSNVLVDERPADVEINGDDTTRSE